MKYVLLLSVDEFSGPPDLTDPATRPMMERDRDLRAELEAEGVWCGGQALEPTVVATGVRVRDGEVLLHDGPFAETHDHLTGYYLIDCDDLDHAVSVAVRVPAAEYGTIEIRPVWDYEAVLDRG